MYTSIHASNDGRARAHWSIVPALMLTAVSAVLFLPQEQALAADVGADLVLEEVITTARRREETLMDVPVAITVTSGDALERIGAENIISIGQTAPNVTLEVSRGTNTTLTAFIRGVGQQDPVAGFESGVGLYLDDVYFNRPHAAVLDLYDVQRIEVLRGPQGTLYGRNTIGGAIKYVTRPLSDEAEGKFRLSVGTESQIDTMLSGSTPLSDTFRIGGTVALFTRDGFGKNINTGADQYDKSVVGSRLTAEWDATPDLFFRLTGDKTQDESSPKSGHREFINTATCSLCAPLLPGVFDTQAGLVTPIQEVDSLGGALMAQWTINDSWTLKNIIAYRDDSTLSPIDFDSLPVADLDVPVNYDNHQFSEELQLQYTGDRWNGVVGYYQLSANAYNYFDVLLDQLAAGFNANTIGDVDTETWSMFADFTYDVNDDVTVSVGGRYTSDERRATVVRRSFLGGLSPVFGGMGAPFATTSNFNGSEEFKEFSPRVSATWSANDTNNLYFSYSEGFKGGGFDPRGQTNSAPDLNNDSMVSAAEVFQFMQFDPETVKSYEFGLKSRLMGGRMQTSLAVFFGDYEDVQIPGSIGVDTDNDGINDTFTGVTTNAGRAELPGIEFEGIFRATENWSFSWALGWLDAEYKEFINASGVNVASTAVFQNTPDLTAHGAATYEMPMNLFGQSGSFAAIGSFSYRDDASQFEFANPLLDQTSFTLVDLSLVWEDDDGNWRAGLHGKNLGDKEYKVAGYNFPTLGLEGNVTAFYGNPRTVTATVERRF